MEQFEVRLNEKKMKETKIHISKFVKGIGANFITM